jgi:O-antigen/teichoic acid export membrane protein
MDKMSSPTSVPAASSSRIFKNFGFLVFGKLFADSFMFIYFVLIARSFGQVGIGHYSFAMGLTGLFAVFADSGLNKLSIKEMSCLKSGVMAHYSQVLSLRLVLCLLAIVSILLVTWVISFPRELVIIIWLIGTYQVLTTLVDGFGAIFVSREQMHITSLLDMSQRIFTALLGVSIILCGGGLILTIAALPLMSLIHAGIGYVLAVRYYGYLAPWTRLYELTSLLSKAFPYGLHSFLEQLLIRLPVILLGILIGTAAAGIFNTSHRIILLLTCVAMFAPLSLFPAASKHYVESKARLKDLYHRSVNSTILVALPAAAGLWLISSDLIDVVYGQGFEESAHVLEILAWMLIVGPLKGMFEVFLTAADRQSEIAKGYFWTSCASVPIFLFAILQFGAIGAASVMISMETILACIFLIRLGTVLGTPRVGKRMVISLIGVCAFLIPLPWAEPDIGLWQTIGAASLIYLGVMLSFRDIRQGEGKFLMGIMRDTKIALFRSSFCNRK